MVCSNYKKSLKYRYLFYSICKISLRVKLILLYVPIHAIKAAAMFVVSY
jgi:hypothetical protein